MLGGLGGAWVIWDGLARREADRVLRMRAMGEAAWAERPERLWTWEGCVAGVLAELWAGLELESLLVDLGTGPAGVKM